MHYKHYPKHKTLWKFLAQYGFHLWILLFVSNVLLFYSFNFFSYGQTADEQAQNITSTDLAAAPSSEAGSPTPTKPVTQQTVRRQPTPKPKGPVVNLTFTVPGIGSGGGTMNPVRKTRSLTIYLYAPDVNSYDPKVKPLYTMKTTSNFDDNPDSPTYTTFLNKAIDLGDTVKNGKYQVAFSTDQSLRRVIREKENELGGRIVTVSRNERAVLPVQSVLMGDVMPAQGNNAMNIDDYTFFVKCYSNKEKCPSIRQVDLNDDGTLDGIDYNIMMLGFKGLLDMGFPVPKLSDPQPTQVNKLSELESTPRVSPNTEPSKAPEKQASGSGGAAGIIGGIFFVLLLLAGGAAGFFFWKKKQAAKKAETPPPSGETVEVGPSDPTAPPAPEGDAAVPVDGSTEAIAASTEIPVSGAAPAPPTSDVQSGTENPAPSDMTASPATEPTDTPAPAADGAIDKVYYVKNKSKDDKGTWFTLTDDAGAIDGLYTGDIENGFERIIGTMTEENGKKYVLISEVLPPEEAA